MIVFKLIKGILIGVLVLSILGIMVNPEGTADTLLMLGGWVGDGADKAGRFFSSLGDKTGSS